MDPCRGGRDFSSTGSGSKGGRNSSHRPFHSRGEGRGGRGRQQGRGGPHRGPPNAPRPLNIFTSDFDAFRKSCDYAVSYKVHRPNCPCPNVVRLLSDVRQGIRRVVYRNNNHNPHEVEEGLTSEQPIDGLIVVPQTRSIPSIYLCLDTTEETFLLSPKQAELKLATELFDGRQRQQQQLSGDDADETGIDAIHNNNNNNKKTKSPRNSRSYNDLSREYKVSCAACLLEDIPNGFACVLSTNQDDVNRVRDQARKAANEKIEDRKHSDHAHFVATVPIDTLIRLHRSKTRHQIQTVQDELIQILIHQDIPIEPDTINDIKLQHHITSFLWLFHDRNEEQINTTPTTKWSSLDEVSSSSSPWYCLVLGYDDRKEESHHSTPHWSLDLPGGKRHLGENTLEAAIRETEEETSLVWDKNWIRDQWRGDGPSGFMNQYYLLSPPPPKSDE